MFKLTGAMRANADALNIEIKELRSIKKPRDPRSHLYQVWMRKQIDADAVERYQFALRRLADATDCDECPEEFESLVFRHDILPKLLTRMSGKPGHYYIDTKVWFDDSQLAKDFRAWLGYVENHPDEQPMYV